MEAGSLTFRVARVIAAGAAGAARSLLVLVVLLAVGLPLARVAASWYVRGTLDLAPADVRVAAAETSELAVKGGTERETLAIRRAVGTLRYRVDPRAISVVVIDNDPGCENCAGEYLPYLDIIRVQRDIADADGVQLEWTMAHEIGHYVDQRYMTDAARTRFRSLRHIPPSLTWAAMDSPWQDRPDEDFAEVFAALAVPTAFTPPATAYGRVRDPAAYEELLRSVGVVFGRAPPPTGWGDVLAREFALARDTVTDPRLEGPLLALAAAYVALGAVPAGLRAWRRGAGEESTPRLDRRWRRVLNTGRPITHTGRSTHVTHADRDHGGGRLGFPRLPGGLPRRSGV
jgi:hypothetical protein